MFSTSFSNMTFIYRDIPLFCPHVSKVVCCRFVVCGKGLKWFHCVVFYAAFNKVSAMSRYFLEKVTSTTGPTSYQYNWSNYPNTSESVIMLTPQSWEPRRERHNYFHLKAFSITWPSIKPGTSHPKKDNLPLTHWGLFLKWPIR